MLAAGVLAVVVMLILPIPHWLLDAMLVISIGVSIVIALIATNVDHPLKFSTFPSVLLLSTLLRLALSIAATKLILGEGNAGHVIQTFGNFVMGGDFIVGLVAFLIIVIVQFVVITNGAGRVAEVVARFTLDAMPGKQMSIDADLNSGLITEAEAKQRRKEIKQEADFYGAMDGASKFVKGDAIASVLIILVNIIGGLILGFLRSEGSVMDILQQYALLSVGEGLVSQIPALLVSTSAGLMVTRSGQDSGMGSAVAVQVLSQPKALMGVAASLAVLAFIPGFPTVTFLALAAGAFGLYKFSETNSKYIAHTAPAGGGVAHPGEPQPSQAAAQPQGPEAVMPLLHVDPIELEIGYGLTKLADARQGGDLPTRVAGVRRQLALELGFVMPSVRIRDNVQLAPNEYVIRIRGEEVARSEAFVDSCLAIDSGGVLNPVLGTQTKDPVFGIDALWIEKSQREAAERSGYTVIEPSAMISTHLSEVVKSHSAELLSRQDVQTLLDNVKELDSAVVEELVPTKMTVGEVQKVLQHLLRERIPIRDMVTVLETLADFADRIKDPDSLGELVRASISRTITRQHLDDSGKIYCITLDPGLERSLAEALQQTPYGSVLAIEPELSQAISRDVSSAAAKALADSKSAVVLCGNSTRLPLKRLLERHQVTTPVLAFNEISASADVEFVAQIQHAAIAA
ncbi:flagellar biosynthesis protein FlhA [Fimbriimonadia bacterium ATM]|nr:MAG: flagellar biosynthesis protein FlhA [Armatimonadota bacterium]MBC6968451.1 flagellar biosynthesis protein FlhA [Armatimonadota bacterium]MCE7898711.1 flagellar biosynthesis protein FlhA [Armatimonadetes bacterium ATM1]MDL1927997.1 flagellar biosynthesis protein FlhA [Fimbriimonadia bacterium ATM]RIJ98518.1 MAG: flagellar biosynthesis protein FlhA [Armatimonadota bacterium]